MKIEKLKPSEITPYFRNPRKNEDAIEGVAESIQAFGFQNPIIIDNNNVIVCGHTRWKAALKLELKEIPCIRTNGLSEAKIKAYRIADNKYGERAEWDFALLKDEFAELDTGEIDLELTGFNLDEIEQMMTIYGDEYSPSDEWKGMPEFNQEDKTAYQSIHVHFLNQKDVDSFAKLIKQNITEKTRSIWYPEIIIEKYADKEYK